MRCIFTKMGYLNAKIGEGKEENTVGEATIEDTKMNIGNSTFGKLRQMARENQKKSDKLQHYQ